MINSEISQKLQEYNIKYKEISEEIRRMRFKNTLSIINVIEQRYRAKIATFLEYVERRIDELETPNETSVEFTLPIKEINNV